MKPRRERASAYYLILSVTIVLVLIGLVMISSASTIFAYYTQQKDSFYYVKRQIVYILLGLMALTVMSRVDYGRVRRLSLGLMLLAVGALAAIMLPNVGTHAGGANRWVSLWGFTVQPSEFAKLAMVIYAADVLARFKKPPQLGDVRKSLGLPILVVCGLVLAQPDLGTALAIGLTVFVMLYLANVRLREVAVLGLSSLVVVGIAIMSASYRRARFLAFLDPWADPRGNGFQIIQSLLALGSGGVTGVGLGLSRQKFGYLPAPFTDFIFPIVGEELGLVGALTVVGLFIVLALVGWWVARRAPDRFGRLLAGGITTMILGQAVINMGSVTGLLPITGIPLPLVSYGGSSLLLTMAGIGILLNIAGRAKNTVQVGKTAENRDLRRGNRRSYLSRHRSSRSA